jgi:Zn-dependent peptidase ImmA (M78 family)
MSRYFTDEQLEDFGRKLRRRLDIEHQPRPDMLTTIVKLKGHDRRFNYQRVADDLLPDAEAQWDSDEWVIKLREATFQGIQRGQPRARFVAAEEMMHYLLGHQGVLNRSIQKTVIETAVARIRSQESEARRAAAVFLAPEYLAPEEVSPAIIADFFAISFEAATFRTAEVERLRRRRLNVERLLPPVAVDFLKEAKRRGFEVKSLDDDQAS